MKPGAVTGGAPLRVLHLGSPAGLYGAERWILALVRYLPDDVESLVGVIRDVPGSDPEICTLAAGMGCRTVVVEAPGRVNFSAIGKLREVIRANDIHILHTHGYKTDILGALAVRGTACRIVATPHGWSADAGWKLQCYEALNRVAFRFHHAVVPLSADLHAGLAESPGLGGKLHLIRNGVDLSEVDAAVAKPDVLAGFRGSGRFLFGYIGQLIPRKGLTTLLQAFSALREEQAHLLIVGEGEQRAELERLAARSGLSDRVSFAGYRADRLDLLKCFDAFVLPSTLEGIPRCILESMAARVPVIASDIPGSTDVVTDGLTGMTFPVNNPAELAIRMRKAIHSREQVAIMAAAAEKRVREEYSAEAMAGAYARLYRDLAHGNPDGSRRRPG